MVAVPHYRHQGFVFSDGGLVRILKKKEENKGGLGNVVPHHITGGASDSDGTKVVPS